LRKVCKLSDDVEIELCDMHAEVKHLQENKDANAIGFLKEKEKYILLKHESIKEYNKKMKKFLLIFDFLILKKI
jgi:hypothetical protein